MFSLLSRRRIVKSLISHRGRLSSLNNKIFVRFDSFKQSLFFRWPWRLQRRYIRACKWAIFDWSRYCTYEGLDSFSLGMKIIKKTLGIQKKTKNVRHSSLRRRQRRLSKQKHRLIRKRRITSIAVWDLRGEVAGDLSKACRARWPTSSLSSCSFWSSAEPRRMRISGDAESMPGEVK